MSVASVAYKLLDYKTEQARKKREHASLSQKKLDLTLSLIFKNSFEETEYQKNKSFKRNIDGVIYRQQIKHAVTRYMNMLKLNKKMDSNSILKHVQEYHKFLTQKNHTNVYFYNGRHASPIVIKVVRTPKPNVKT